MAFVAAVNVMLKEGIADPQGQTIERALPALGFAGVDERARRQADPTWRSTQPRSKRHSERVEQMCERLLANPVIESFEVTIRAMTARVGDRRLPRLQLRAGLREGLR